MKWYTKYLSVFEQPFAAIPHEAVAHVRRKLASRQSANPFASIILIAHNEENRILACLWSLCDNTSGYPVEIFVVNNASTDRTEDVLKTLRVPYLNESNKGPGYSRQCGLNHARGKYCICVDADTLYPPRHIQTHIDALGSGGVVCAFSLWSFVPGGKYPAAGLWILETLRDAYLRVQALKRPELCVRGMALSFNTRYGRMVGFRPDIIRGEDGSLALGLKKYGRLKLITSRKARVLTSSATLRADGSLTGSLLARARKAIKGLPGLFTVKERYEDDDTNIIRR